MKFSYNWLQDYFSEKLPPVEDIARLLGTHSFEIEGTEEITSSITGKKDVLIDIDVLPNRAHDCFSYIGMAREIGTLLNLEARLPSYGPRYDFTDNNLKTSDFITLSVEDSVLVPRSMKRLVKDVKVAPSPEWLVEKLSAIGQRSINNIVDATNFVMWETGQPVHCFDFDKLKDGENGKKNIEIKKAKNGEKITMLDNKEFELNDEVIVISDGENSLDIAGIKGGKTSGIDDGTKNIILSVDNFNSTSIRKTSKRLGIRTDASIRFENGISPQKTEEAMERLSQIIQDFSGGKVADDILEVYPKKANQHKVGVSVREINKLLGIEISEQEVEKILMRMNFQFQIVRPLEKILETATSLIGVPYKMGSSITYDAPNFFDCSSFTSYLFVQAGIPIPRMSVDQYFYGVEIDEEDLSAGDLIFSNTGEGNIFYRSIEFLTGSDAPLGVDHCGLYLGDGKVIHSTRKKNGVLIENLKESEQFKNITGYRRILKNDDKRFVIIVPYERLDLRIKEELIEEIGRIYGYVNIKEVFPSTVFNPPAVNPIYKYGNIVRDLMLGAGFSEVYNYALVNKGDVELANALASDKGFLRADLLNGLRKTAKDNLKYFNDVKIFEIGKIFWKESNKVGERFNFAIMLSKQKIKDKEKVEMFYKVKGILEIILSELHIKDFSFDEADDLLWNSIVRVSGEKIGNIAWDGFELDFEKLISKIGKQSIYKTSSKYPSISRDVAIFVLLEVKVRDVENLIKEVAGELMVDLNLFDIYEKEENKSLAFRMTLQSYERTLSDEEANEVNARVIEALEKNKDWIVRK